MIFIHSNIQKSPQHKKAIQIHQSIFQETA